MHAQSWGLASIVGCVAALLCFVAKTIEFGVFFANLVSFFCDWEITEFMIYVAVDCFCIDEVKRFLCEENVLQLRAIGKPSYDLGICPGEVGLKEGEARIGNEEFADVGEFHFLFLFFSQGKS